MTTTDPTTTNGHAAIVATHADASVIPDDAGGALNAFASQRNFETGQRLAKALASSTLVPKEYQGNVANCLVAIEVASRIRCSVFMVCQSLDIVHGRPSWRASFLIATVNACGRFTPLRFRWEGSAGSDGWGCRAVSKDRESGEECLGALITIGLAKAEGWYQRNGSKWRTMPEQMMMYRAAAFWTRAYAPELSLGMQTAEELADVGPVSEEIVVRPAASRATAADLEARLRETPATAVETTAETKAEAPSGPALEAAICLYCDQEVGAEREACADKEGHTRWKHPGCTAFGKGS